MLLLEKYIQNCQACFGLSECEWVNKYINPFILIESWIPLVIILVIPFSPKYLMKILEEINIDENLSDWQDFGG